MVLCINVSVYTLVTTLSNLLCFVADAWLAEGLLLLSRIELFHLHGYKFESVIL